MVRAQTFGKKIGLKVPEDSGRPASAAPTRVLFFYAGKNGISGNAVPGYEPVIVVLEHMHIKVRRQQRSQFGQAHRHHRMLVTPDLPAIYRKASRFRAARPGSIEHRLVDIQTAAHIAHIKQVPHMRSGATGQIQMALATVAQQLLQAMNALALRLVVDFGTHQIVVTGKVGIDGVDGHESLGLK